jgi:hypothetical protein
VQALTRVAVAGVSVVHDRLAEEVRADAPEALAVGKVVDRSGQLTEVERKDAVLVTAPACHDDVVWIASCAASGGAVWREWNVSDVRSLDRCAGGRLNDCDVVGEGAGGGLSLSLRSNFFGFFALTVDCTEDEGCSSGPGRWNHRCCG